MADGSAEKIIERRRVQNRDAQRRFREKKSVQKTLEFLQRHRPPYQNLDDLPQLPFQVDLSMPHTFPEGESATPTRAWDPAAPNTLAAGGTSLFEYYKALGDGSQVLVLPTPPHEATDIEIPESLRMSTTDSSNGTSTDHVSCLAESSLSPRDDVLPESPAVTPPSPTSGNSSLKCADGWLSPLHMAAKKGSTRVIQMLLDHNCDCDELDSQDMSPLAYAVMGGHEEATWCLLNHGAQISSVQGESKGPHASAIHWAVLKRHEAVLKLLLDRVPDPKIICGYDDHGRAPLHIAIDIEFDAAVSLLLKAGADPSQKAALHHCALY
ncbi:ankyrin repeat-containing domain protein [Daldinia bambusicola]|nr:ankyrin repeat-containing domain protein [Daldinia bambusicola]